MWSKERETLAELCHMLYRSGILAGSEGNVSLRAPTGEILLTPSSRHKGLLTPEDMLVTTLDGTLLEGSGRITKEFSLHAMLYDERPELGCVVHGHPVYGCAYAILGKGIPENYLLQMKMMVGPLGVAGYAPAGSRELVEAVRPFASDCNTIILQNHGMLFCGKDWEDALCRSETAENIAHSIILAERMGSCQMIPGSADSK